MKKLMQVQNAPNFWLNIPSHILLHILSLLSLVDCLADAAAVCKSWSTAVSEILSASPKRSDLTPDWNPHEYINQRSLPRNERETLNRAFVRGIHLSLQGQGEASSLNLRPLAFGPHFQLKARHLLYAGSRCRNLRELVLPRVSYNPTQNELTEIFRQWSGLESLTLGRDLAERYGFFEILGKNCPNLKVLDFCCHKLYLSMVVHLRSYLPGVKILKINCRTNNNDLYFGLYELFEFPELEQISVTVDNELVKYSRASNSVPWQLVLVVPAHTRI